jgi:phosphate transport system substrate-binding protein
MKKLLLFLIVMSFFSIGCKTSNENATEIDTPTSGEITVSVDETLQPIAEAQVDIFQHQYPNAKINLRYRAEADCINDLFKDSCKLIFLGRTLKEAEMKAFKENTFNPPHLKVATDAIALVVNAKNRDTAFTYPQILKILRGEDKQYNIVFDNQFSGTVSYILNLTGQKTMPKNTYAMKSNLEAVNYVASHENTMGIIGWSWISDSDDPKTRDYLSKIRLVSISSKDDKEPGFHKPYQLNLAQGKYPLSREVYIIQRERRNGLAAGFTSFVSNDIGQTIILKSGLLPANQQQRLIEMKTKNIGKVKE